MIAPSPDFIGRTAELTALHNQLTDSRLLTLVGPDGVGKTTLALALGQTVAADFPGGVHVVSLAKLESAKIGDSFHPLAAAIAAALDFVFYGPRESGQQLLAYLRAQEIALILDDFDHLPDGREFITAVLQETANVKLIITSREPLELEGEWTYPVKGLAAPPAPDAADWASYDAIQLFQQTAARQRPAFDLQTEKSDLIRFCQLVEGNPLALKLAAASQSALAPINRALGAPGNGLHKLLDYLWRRLGEGEQRVLAELALLRGSFTVEAAAQVAGAAPDSLDNLVRQALLIKEKDGRCQWHHGLRQYALAKLDAFDAVAARDNHSGHYAKELAQLWSMMRGAGYLTAVNQIKRDIDNIRAAWQWAAQRGHFAQLEQMMAPLWLFYAESEWTTEGLDRFSWAAETLADAAQTPAQQIVYNQLIAHQAWFHHLKDENKIGAALIQTAVNKLRQLEAGWPLALAWLTAGVIYYRRRRYDEARDALQASADLYAQLGDKWGRAICLNRMGEAERRVGNYHQAKQLYAQSLAMFQEIEYPLGLAWVFSNLAVIAREEGDYDHAITLLEESLRLSQANRRYQAVCICLTISGQIKLLQGNYREAYPLCQEAYELASSRGDELSAAFSARYLGHICLDTAKYAQAERFYTASQAAFWRAGDISGVATSYAHLAEVARQQGNWEAAEQLARQGIKQTRTDLNNLLTDFLELLVTLARLYTDTQRAAAAARLLAFVREQGMGRQVVMDKMAHCEQLVTAVLPRPEQKVAEEWGRQQTVESILGWLDQNNN